jgi:hypothetical protein
VLNTQEAQEKRLSEIRGEILAGDQGWRATIDFRYGELEVEIALGEIVRARGVIQSIKSPLIGSAPQGLLQDAYKLLAAGTGRLTFAAALIAGHCSVKDPIESEANCRLFMEANQQMRDAQEKAAGEISRPREPVKLDIEAMKTADLNFSEEVGEGSAAP